MQCAKTRHSWLAYKAGEGWRKAPVMLRPRRYRSCFRDKCSQLISACLPQNGCQGWTRTRRRSELWRGRPKPNGLIPIPNRDSQAGLRRLVAGVGVAPTGA